MKLLLFCISIFLSIECFSQESNGTQYFVQGMIYSEDTDRIEELVNELRLNPNIFVVRYDNITKGILVVTQHVNLSLTKEVFQTWLTDNSDLVSCIRVGMQSIDSHYPFPLTNCENE